MHLALQAAELLLVGWLVGALVFRIPMLDRERRAALDAGERVYWAVVIGVTVSVLLTFTLAVFHRYSFERLLAADGAIASTIALVFRGRLRLGGSARRPGLASLLPLALVVLGAVRFFPTAEYIIAGKDPGTYVNEGVQIAQRGSIVTLDPVVASVPPFARDLFFPSHHLPEYYGTRFMGFFLQNPDTGAVIGQFHHFYPASLAIGYGIDGLSGVRRTVGVWAILGLLAVYFAGARLFGRTVAFAGCLLLALHVIEVWFARYPNSEMPMQALLFAGLLANARAHVDGDRFFAPVAGVLFGALLFLRIDAGIAIAAVGASLALGAFAGQRPRISFIAPLLVAGALSVAYVFGPLRAYVLTPLVFLQALALVGAPGGTRGGGRGDRRPRDRRAPAAAERACGAVGSPGAGRGHRRGRGVRAVAAPAGRQARADGRVCAAHVHGLVPHPAGAAGGARRTRGVRTAGVLARSGAAGDRDRLFPLLVLQDPDRPPALLDDSTVRPHHPAGGVTARLVCRGRRHPGRLARRTSSSTAARVGVPRPAGRLVRAGEPPRGGPRRVPGMIPRIEKLAGLIGDDDLAIVESRDAGSDVHTLGLPLAYIYGRQVLVLYSARPDKPTLAEFLEWAHTRYARVLFIGAGGTDLLSYRYGVRSIDSERFQVPEYDSPLNAYPRFVRHKEFDFGVYEFTPPQPRSGLWFDLDVGTNDDLHVLRFHAKETSSEGRTFRWTRATSYIAVTTLPPDAREVTVTMSNGGRPAGAAPAVVEVYLHGQLLGRAAPTGDFEPYGFAIPPALAARAAAYPDPVELKFVSTLWNPHAVLGSPDDRDLGVMVDRVAVR